MKDYIKSLIKRDGEQAAGKIDKNMKEFIVYLYLNHSFVWMNEIDKYFEKFENEILNK